MKNKIIRNIAIVSAIFAMILALMLIVNYFQVKSITPLQTGVVDVLKQLNDQGAGNAELQEQIRQLDLLARKAYFVRLDHLMAGLYILLGMLAVLVVTLRLYYKSYKEIPQKDIDPIDEWAIKSKARKYVMWSGVGVVTVALVSVLMSAPFLRPATDVPAQETSEEIAANDTSATNMGEAANIDSASTAQAETTDGEATSAETSAGDSTAGVAAGTTTAGTTETTIKEESKPEAAASTVTHNAFRGNNSNGVSSAKGVPTSWNLADGTNIAWKQKVPRKGHSSPVINGNRVFLTGADEQARELYCYDLNTGKLLWTLTASGIAGSPSQAPVTEHDTGLAAPTVATNGNQVCAIFATGDIICADMQGKRLWAKNISVPDNHYGYSSSLLIFGNSVIIQYDNLNSPRVFALDLATGNERWSRSRQEKTTWSSPIIAYVNNSPQLVLMGNPSISAYNPNNGEPLWRVDALSGEVGSSPCSAAGVIFGASEYSKLVAINGADGSVLWESTEFLPEVSSPVATRDNLYLATSYGVIASFDTKTGALRKEHDMSTEFYSSPIIAEGKLYIISNSGKVCIFSANNDFSLINSFETAEKTFATPAMTDGKIVVRTENSIYCVEAK